MVVSQLVFQPFHRLPPPPWEAEVTIKNETYRCHVCVPMVIQVFQAEKTTTTGLPRTETSRLNNQSLVDKSLFTFDWGNSTSEFYPEFST